MSTGASPASDASPASEASRPDVASPAPQPSAARRDQNTARGALMEPMLRSLTRKGDSPPASPIASRLKERRSGYVSSGRQPPGHFGNPGVSFVRKPFRRTNARSGTVLETFVSNRWRIAGLRALGDARGSQSTPNALKPRARCSAISQPAGSAKNVALVTPT